MKPKYVADSNDVPDIVEERNPVNGLQHTYCGYGKTGTVAAGDGITEGGTVTGRMFPDGSMLYYTIKMERAQKLCI